MVSIYNNIPVVILDDGTFMRESYQYTYVPHIKDTNVIPKQGDNLLTISRKNFGTPEYWGFIGVANNIIDPFQDLGNILITIPYNV